MDTSMGRCYSVWLEVGSSLQEARQWLSSVDECHMPVDEGDQNPMLLSQPSSGHTSACMASQTTLPVFLATDPLHL